MATLQCAITSPEGLLFEGEARSVVVPAIDGELGILPRHAPLIAVLGSGELRIDAAAQKPLRFFLDGGFVQVLKNRVTVLATSAEPVEGMDRAGAEAKLKAVLDSPPPKGAPPEERDGFQDRVRVARRRVKLAR